MGVESSKPIAADPAYLKMCEEKAFLLAKAIDPAKGYESLAEVSKVKQKLEVKHGAKLIVSLDHNPSAEYSSFEDEVPFGAGTLVQNEDLALDFTDSGSNYAKAYAEYAAATKYGVLIVNFETWAKSSNVCSEALKDVPKERLFAYIEHTEEDDGGRQGYIVNLDPKKKIGTATVEDGRGYILWHNGAHYHGEIQSGHRNGKGVYKFKNGDVYEGEYKAGKRTGKGKYTWANGDSYDGDWKDDKKEGEGKNVYANGDVYRGGWLNHLKSGKGMMTYANGDVFEGEWTNNKRTGFGKFQWNDGDVYKGEWKDDKREGQGVFTWAAGDEYRGEWRNGWKNGLGTIKYANGDLYEGEWKDNKKHGQGKKTWSSDAYVHCFDVYEGEFMNGKKHGKGTFTWASGNIYEGYFSDDNQHGIGKKTFKDGRVQVGTWENNKFLDLKSNAKDDEANGDSEE